LSHVLQTVAGDDHGRCVLRALTQISDGLRAHGSPIDYERRRHIAATATPIDLKSWDGICAAAGVATGGHRKLRHARLWVWELLTGGLPAQAPESVRPNHNSVLADYQRFALRLPHDAVNLLEAHARSVRDSHGCASEPIAWSPPTEWVDLEGLPVPALDQLDLERLAVLLRTERSPIDIAEELNTTLDHVRLVVRGTPELFEPRSRTRAAGSPHRIIPPANLTTDRLGSLVVDEKRTLTSLAAEFGVGRNYLADRLRREGIPVPPSRRRPVHLVDPQWLRVEYLVRRRTLPDIAAEVGTTAPNIARIARMNNIPLRGRGGRSHAASLSTPGDWPKLLAGATRGQGGTERVRRFQVYARLRSLNQAAGALGAHQSVLTMQLAKLESACGGELLVRSTRRQERQRLTELGRRLLAQADEHLGAHPEAPSSLPQPLATAISSFWGSKRLHWFEVSAHAESLTRAATVLGCDRYALDRSIRGLEQAVGGVLLQRSTPVKPHTVTALGRKLLAQMETRFGASA